MSGYSEEAEMQARRLGFKSAEEAINFYRNREVKDTTPRQSSWGGLGEPSTWLDQINSHSMHPKNMFSYITEMLRGVNARK